MCPWNRGIERRRASTPLPEHAEPTVSLVEWLEAEDADLMLRYERLFVPKNDARYLRRNALVALGNSGAPEHRAAVESFVDDPDEMLRETAEWSLERLRDRDSLG